MTWLHPRLGVLGLREGTLPADIEHQIELTEELDPMAEPEPVPEPTPVPPEKPDEGDTIPDLEDDEVIP